MTLLRQALLAGAARATCVAIPLALGGWLLVSQASGSWAAWTDSAAVTGATLGAHVVVPPTTVDCDGGGLLAQPLIYSWPSEDLRYTYRVQLVDSTGTVRQTDVVPESGQGSYSVTYAADDLPAGSFTVRVSSFLTGSTSWTSATATSHPGSKTTVLLNLTTACG